MTKKEIYHRYARIIREDGTWSDLKKVYMNHDQQDENILKRACQEMSEYVNFCLHISECYWSKTRQAYRQFGDDLDYDNYQIHFYMHGFKITNETDLSAVDYPNIEGLMKMKKLNRRYRKTFMMLLDGNFFLNEHE